MGFNTALLKPLDLSGFEVSRKCLTTHDPTGKKAQQR